MKKKINSYNIISINKKAYKDYYIIKEIESGIILQGWEVKSLRKKQVSISNSYIFLRHKEAYLCNATFQVLHTVSKYLKYNTLQDRKLLLNRKEIDILQGMISKKNNIIIALSLYWKYSFAKLKIGVAQGKKKYDHRQDIKKRQWKLDKQRIIKYSNR